MKSKYFILIVFLVVIFIAPIVAHYIRSKSHDVDYAAINKELEKLNKEIERSRIENGEYVLIDDGDSLYHTSVRCRKLKSMPEVTFKFIIEEDKTPCPVCCGS